MRSFVGRLVALFADQDGSQDLHVSPRCGLSPVPYDGRILHSSLRSHTQVAFFLRKSRPAHANTISSVLLRALQPVQALLSTTITIDEFEWKALHFISREVARSKLAQNTLEKLAISKFLEVPAEKLKKGAVRGEQFIQSSQSPSLIPREEKGPFLHIITLGNSPLVSGVLSSLIHYLLTVTAHSYSILHPGVNTMSKEQEAAYLARPNRLRLTLAETRPSCDGVTLAEELHEVVNESSGRAKQLREMARSYSDPRRIHLAGSTSAVQMPSGLQERLLRGMALRVTGDDTMYWTLGELLRAADAKRGGSDGTKVEIEVVPDLALASVLRAANQARSFFSPPSRSSLVMQMSSPRRGRSSSRFTARKSRRRSTSSLRPI